MALSKVLVALVLLVSLSTNVSAHLVPKPAPVAVAPASPPVYSPAPSPMVCVTSAKKKNKPVVLTAVTDKNGYFFIPPSKKVSHLGAQKRCKVFLYSAPKKSKSMTPTNLNSGLTGAYLKRVKPSKPLPFALFTVGPFAYAPPPCKKSTTF
ncbi:hypothetical protein MKW98_003960 [Papaver atlanticum]|uniref:Uncharacterized protein n=1 Tax=Papaver atlanticum TaxID=357466 RepID=A0AAD4SN01_9MAGN|nr:hypothetical protein MKW98_003960 [Papaver atlanticum]